MKLSYMIGAIFGLIVLHNLVQKKSKTNTVYAADGLSSDELSFITQSLLAEGFDLETVIKCCELLSYLAEMRKPCDVNFYMYTSNLRLVLDIENTMKNNCFSDLLPGRKLWTGTLFQLEISIDGAVNWTYKLPDYNGIKDRSNRCGTSNLDAVLGTRKSLRHFIETHICNERFTYASNKS